MTVLTIGFPNPLYLLYVPDKKNYRLANARLLVVYFIMAGKLIYQKVRILSFQSFHFLSQGRKDEAQIARGTSTLLWEWWNAEKKMQF